MSERQVRRTILRYEPPEPAVESLLLRQKWGLANRKSRRCHKNLCLLLPAHRASPEVGRRVLRSDSHALDLDSSSIQSPAQLLRKSLRRSVSLALDDGSLDSPATNTRSHPAGEGGDSSESPEVETTPLPDDVPAAHTRSRATLTPESPSTRLRSQRTPRRSVAKAKTPIDAEEGESHVREVNQEEETGRTFALRASQASVRRSRRSSARDTGDDAYRPREEDVLETASEATDAVDRDEEVVTPRPVKGKGNASPVPPARETLVRFEAESTQHAAADSSDAATDIVWQSEDQAERIPIVAKRKSRRSLAAKNDTWASKVDPVDLEISDEDNRLLDAGATPGPGRMQRGRKRKARLSSMNQKSEQGAFRAGPEALGDDSDEGGGKDDQGLGGSTIETRAMKRRAVTGQETNSPVAAITSKGGEGDEDAKAETAVTPAKVAEQSEGRPQRKVRGWLNPVGWLGKGKGK